MSEEMAVSDNTTGEEDRLTNDETVATIVAQPEEVALERPVEQAAVDAEETTAPIADSPPPEVDPEEQGEPAEPIKAELQYEETPAEPVREESEEDDPVKEEDTVASEENGDDVRGIKRRASSAFSDLDEEDTIFKGFDVKEELKTEAFNHDEINHDEINHDEVSNDEANNDDLNNEDLNNEDLNNEDLNNDDLNHDEALTFKGFDDIKEEVKTADYSRILERLQAEVSAATKAFVPLRTVMATPPAPTRATKRPRKDTDGSRPSSALSSRSEGDGSTDASSPASRGGRRPTTEMSSPLLRIPLERGWKRELVYRAALDPNSKRNGDIYYYTPQGKKLRSTREVGEHLTGTGLTLENFSFFKEPLGVDDPEKEIIRDAKLMRRMESPIAATTPVAPVEGKRTPKPKMPKGASPEPQQNSTVAAATVKTPPAKIKIKSVGSRLSTSTPTPPAATTALKEKQQPQQLKKPPPPASITSDNNNSSAWKKPRAPAPTSQPPPLVSRPPEHDQHAKDAQSPRQLVQPCSMTCGRGVPTLSCAACLCLYHAACAGYVHIAPPDPFLCKNCRKSTSPPLEPPPLTHKSGVTAVSLPVPVPVPVPVMAPVPRRVPIPVPVPVPAKVPRDKRVLLRMKVAGGTPDGERVWAVSDNQPQPSSQSHKPAPNQQAQAVQSAAVSGASAGRTRTLPQSLAVVNGRRFIIVPRSVIQAQTHDASRRGRVANGASSPTMSPRRRGRPRVDDTDHFTAFYNKAQENNYNVVVQIFQYLGMRDLAHSARVSRLWRQLAATPALWRHVRMKNSHVSDWAGLCAALQRHGTKRLDLRKMLLPPKDAEFWEQFGRHIGTVSTLERIEMCRCPAGAVEAVCRGLPGLRALSALAIRDASLDPAPLAALPLLHELRIKSMAGLSLTRDLRHLAALTRLQHLSLTSIKELGWCLCDVIGSLPALESLELGECTFRAEFAGVLTRLARLRRVRLERGTPHCAAPDILRALATLPLLTRLELVNIDVKPGFDDALALCTNVQRLLIIPTYVSQSATTNRQVLSGVLRLKDSLTHLMWGVTIELLRVTELFIDQCDRSGEAKRRDVGECIPVLKPVPGCRLPDEPTHVAGPPQVEILPLPTLQRLLSAQLPNTRVKLLRVPFHATWRQSLADFQ